MPIRRHRSRSPVSRFFVMVLWIMAIVICASIAAWLWRTRTRVSAFRQVSITTLESVPNSTVDLIHSIYDRIAGIEPTKRPAIEMVSARLDEPETPDSQLNLSIRLTNRSVEIQSRFTLHVQARSIAENRVTWSSRELQVRFAVDLEPFSTVDHRHQFDAASLVDRDGISLAMSPDLTIEVSTDAITWVPVNTTATDCGGLESESGARFGVAGVLL